MRYSRKLNLMQGKQLNRFHMDTSSGDITISSVNFDVIVHVTRLPVRWDKTVIVVMNEVRVNSPYRPESVTGGTPAANERVRKVLVLERKRLQTRNTGQ
ncbi:hypothetical protein A4A49_13121 [Nicotiana attenuata]|uniref:AD domain-containing protein n=1 Tax=Nicotiana attenuata TaxID=49451 RepID=A0A314KM57_NICAT|nr:hypothetical protein A4A49_13121 [Nicotiana attenuata]